MARGREPRWLTRLVVDAIHADQLREHGGLLGVRDEDVLESALARAQQKWHYGTVRDLPTLAAAYAFGLVKNHPYRDGNKRIGFLAMVAFLGINDYELDATDTDVVHALLALAAGRMSEDELADWIRARSSRRTRTGQ
jgi:death-on-curing protein